MPSIRDFSGGVLNQACQNRDNGGGVLFDCKNVLSSWNGELRKRTGTRLLKELEGDSKVIPYRLPNGDDMIMVLHDKVINCYKFDGNDNLVPYTTFSGQDVAFPTNWSSSTKDGWTVSGNGLEDAEWSSFVYYAITPQDGKGYFYDTRTIKNRSAYYCFECPNASVFSSMRVRWECEGLFGIGAIYGKEPILQYSDDGTNWEPVQTTVSSLNITVDENNIIHVKYNITNNVVTESHLFWRIVFSNYGVYGDESSAFIARLLLENISFLTSGTEANLVFNNCPYDNDDLNNIRWAQNDQTMTMACKGKQPYQITTSSGSFVDSLFAPSDYTAMWTTLGYPACVTYYQNRLWFGGFSSYKTKVYGSEFGKFDKFTIPGTVVATSPIEVDGTEISNTIENMWGGNNALYCLSADGISMIDAQGAMVAANQIEFKLRNREPVNSMVPTVKDDIMVYLGRDKRKILITDFDFVVQRFKAKCISDNYNDFFQSGIKELHYIPRKSSLIYGTLENGKWFALLFDLDKGKDALYPFETSGLVKDVQPIKHGDETKLLMLTHLPTYQYVLEEKLPQSDQEIMDFMTEEEKQDYTKSVLNNKEGYLDHSIRRAYTVATTEIGNLPYYVGEKIEVIADGQYLGGKEVLSRSSGNLYAWEGAFFDGIQRKTVVLYTDTETPTQTSYVYDENYNRLDSYSIFSVTEALGVVTAINVTHPFVGNLLGYSNPNEEPDCVYLLSATQVVTDGEGNQLGIATSVSATQLVFDGKTYDRDASIDKQKTLTTTDNFERESDKDTTTSLYYISLEEPVEKVILGYKYDSYAVLKFITPYTERKFPKEIAVNFINTGYLEVGNTFNSLKSVLNNLVESVSISNKKILMNGNYAKTLDKHSFEAPYVIVRSDKGLPFIITGMDYRVDLSNYQGGV